MNDTIWLRLLYNAVLLLGIAQLVTLVRLRERMRRFLWRQAFVGLILGVIGIVLMLTPWEYMPGVQFDTRSILLGSAGLFLGTIPTLIAILFTAAFRLYQGGGGAWTGVLVIAVTGGIGLAWRHLRKGRLDEIKWGELYLFGLAIHIVMLALMLTLPREIVFPLLARITLPVLLIYPLVTALLGLLMANRLRRERTDAELLNRTEQLQLAIRTANVGFFEKDLVTGQVRFSPEWKSQIGYAADEIGEDSREWESRVHPDDFTATLAQVDAFIQGKTPEYEAQYRFRHKDGSYRWIQARGLLQFDNAGRAVRLLGSHYDITTQKQSEGLYRILTEDIQDVVWILDTQTMRFRYVSPSVERLTGFTPAEILAKPVDQVLDPAAREPILRRIRRRTDTYRLGQKAPGEFFTEELKQLCKDGSTVWTEMITSYSRNPDNGHIEIRGVTRDISERRRAEEALRESEDKFRYIFDHSVVGKSITSLSGEINVNRAFCEMVGYTSEEIQHRHWQEITHPEDIELTQKAVDDILSGEKESRRFVKRFIHKNGTIIWVDLSSSLRRDSQGKPLYLVSTLLDITSQKRAEEELRTSEENYRLLFEQAADGIFIYDLDGNYVDVNSSGCRLLGYTREEILHLSMNDLVTAQSRKTSPLRIRELQAGQFSFSERQMRRKDGRLIDVEISSSRLADGRVLGMARDITARKQAEEKTQAIQTELQRLLEEADQSRQVLLSLVEDQKQAQDQIRSLNADLEKRVHDRTVQLESANKELEAFSYSVSHDLRAPLRAMDGFSAALLQDYPGQLDEKGRHYLERIQEASRRMGQLINDLLSLSRVTRSEFKRQQVDLSGLAREITADFCAQHSTRRIKVEIAPELIVQGDAHLLKIALENLINNAFKFTGNCDEANIQIGSLEQAGEKVYFVRDNGVGFDMNYSGKLFAPFQRLHGMQEFPGTGIGLVTVQRIIQRHGGRVWPDAAPNQGATFYFTLGGA